MERERGRDGTGTGYWLGKGKGEAGEAGIAFRDPWTKSLELRPKAGEWGKLHGPGDA